MLQMFTSSHFSLSLSRTPLYLHSQFYTHFICTHGTQINYKCELSSKLFKDHFLLLIMKPFIISYIKSHCAHATHCLAFLSSVLCKQAYTFIIVQFFAVLTRTACVCLCVCVCLFVSMHLYTVCVCVRNCEQMCSRTVVYPSLTVNMWLLPGYKQLFSLITQHRLEA